MNILLIVLGSLLGLAAVGSGFAKLAKVPNVIKSMESVGVNPSQIPILATLEILESAGLVVGIWSTLLGKVSALCLTPYFIGAVITHFRKRHGFSEFAPAFFLALIAFFETLLQLRR
jgi:DoxX-like family